MINTTFIPRDAGFFSVFNFLIGTLKQGIHAYPYFNKEMFLKLHGSNKHFAYWTDSENCWFDYFEPLKFSDNDYIHYTNEYKNFTRDCGMSAPEEFKVPSETKQLISSDHFQEWRKETNETYAKYIKFNQEIISIVDGFWNNNINPDNHVIGIHYRHPSHFIESGKISLDSYFSVVDKILSEIPNAQIFLASDNTFGIYAFLERYGNKICFFSDIDRITMSEFLEWAFSLADAKPDHVGFIKGKGHELHHKRIGKNNKQMTLDLLTEVLCLSRCNFLVHCLSNISLSISYMNPNINLICLQ
jgi:hypothetical protein